MTFKKIQPTKISNVNIWTPAEGEELIGTLVAVQHNAGLQKKSTLYSVKTDKEVINVWGSIALDDLMKDIPLNSLIKIVYCGTKISKSGVEYKNWEVYLDTDASTEKEDVSDVSEEEELSEYKDII